MSDPRPPTPPPNALRLTLITPPSPLNTSDSSSSASSTSPTPKLASRSAFPSPAAADDVFLSAASSAGPKRPLTLKLPLLSPTSSAPNSRAPSPLPSPLFRDIEARHSTPRGDAHADAPSFPFPGHQQQLQYPTSFRIPCGDSPQHAPYNTIAGVLGQEQYQQQQQAYAHRATTPDIGALSLASARSASPNPYAYAPAPASASMLSVPGGRSPPITPPHTSPSPLPLPTPPRRAPKPQPLPLLPPTPTSPLHALPPLPPSPLFPPHHALSPAFLASYALHPSPELGSGGFGFVLLARARYPPYEDVAVKFIVKNKVPAHGWARDPILGVVPIEVVVLRIVQHECIVRFVDFFEDDVYFYLVQELHGTPWTQQPTLLPLPPTPTTPSYASPFASPSSSSSSLLLPPTPTRPAPPARRASYDLFECIERHSRLSEPQARYVFRQVVTAVLYLHARGISHRDIKDENILIDASFRVKLIDFGSCAIADSRKPAPYHTRFFGTMNFASPEILRGEPYRAPHAEVWTLGILLHILVTGESPFHTSDDAVVGRIASRHQGKMSRGCEELVRGCLRVDPEERWTIEMVGRHEWLNREDR